MGDSFNKKEREKSKQKKKKLKAEKRKERKEAEGKSTDDFVYLDADGNLTSVPPDPNKKKEEVKLEDIVISTPKAEPKEDLPPGVKTGTVKFFNTEKAYGFIIESGSKISYFVHASDLIDQITENNQVQFEVGDGPKGPVAKSVKLV